MDILDRLTRRYRHLQTPPKVGGPADDLGPSDTHTGTFLPLADRYRKDKSANP